MTSGSSVSTCIALASAHFGRNLGRPPVGAAGNGESNPRARSTRNGPQHSPRRPTSERPRRPGDYDVNGWPPAIFSPERRSPTGANGTSGQCAASCGRALAGRLDKEVSSPTAPPGVPAWGRTVVERRPGCRDLLAPQELADAWRRPAAWLPPA